MSTIDVNAAAFSRLPPISEGRPFESAFPSSDAQGSARFQAIAKDAGNAGHMARSQANAWQFLQQLQLRSVLTSLDVGGYPRQVVAELLPDGVDSAPLRGALASANFPATLDVKSMERAALEIGLGVLKTALSAVPLLGGILSAAVDIGAWLFSLGQQSKHVISLTVPWQEYSRDTDEDIVNSFILPIMSGSSDWSALFEPVFQTDLRPFTAEKTTRGGETRAYGVWVEAEASEAIYAPGAYGFMPGTQQIADVVQVARIEGRVGGRVLDAITNVGDYLPSVGQYGQQLWGQVLREGNPDAFKIEPARLAGLWQLYWDAFYAGAIDQIRKLGREKGYSEARIFTRLSAAKAFARFMVTGWTGTPATGAERVGIAPSFVDTAANLFAPIGADGMEIFDNEANSLHAGTLYKRVDDALILPGLRACKLRQLAALARTNVAAYVRPTDGPDGPAFSAFKDTGPAEDPTFNTWGEQLADFCVRVVRPAMLTHEIRWTVPDADARAVDPGFADELAASKAGETSPIGRRVKAELPPLAPVADPPEAAPSSGAVPFAFTGKIDRRTRTAAWLGVLGGTALLTAAGYGIYQAVQR
jgi:hypothetical protein